MNEKVLAILEGLNHVPITLKPNLYKIPSVYIGTSLESADDFNTIYRWCYEMEQKNEIFRIIKTKSGGISVDRRKGFRLPAYRVDDERTGVRILLLLEEGMWKIYFKKNPRNREDALVKNLYPNQAFAKFKAKCKENGIDLDDYKIDNGAEVKKTIESPIIKVENKVFCQRKSDPGFENCHHIDFHSSFLGGLKRTHPEFAPVVDYFYEGRKDNPENKAVLNYTQGWMQSLKNGRKAEWAHLVRDMIKDNNDRVRAVAQALRDNDRQPLLYNTDGIWYCGDIYHGDGEGTVAGTWGNDHTNCTLRIKSAGAYEFIENGKYRPVLRGSTTLDKVKDRSLWEWGDIYDGIVLNFCFIEGVGIVTVDEEDLL